MIGRKYKRLYEEQLQINEELREKNRQANEYVSSLSSLAHALRTSLNHVIGFSRLLLKGISGPLTDQQRVDLQAIHDSGQGMLNLINDTIDLILFDLGEMDLVREPMDLRELLRTTGDKLSDVVGDREGLSFEVDVADDLPVVVADGRRVKQVLGLLLSNALGTTLEGLVRLSATVEGGRVIIAVRDSGLTLPPNEREALFDLPRKSDGVFDFRDRKDLCLPLCARILQAHGERMWVDSAPDGGSIVRFSLPVEGA